MSRTIQSRDAFFRSLDDSGGLVELFRHLDNVHFYIKNRRGQFMAANRPSLLRNGISAERDILGKTDYDFHPPEMAAAYRAEDQLVMDSDRPLPDQIWLVYDHLKVQQWFLCTKVPLHDVHGKVIGVAGAMRTLDADAADSRFGQLAAAVNYVLAHFDENIRIPLLAEMAGCSVSQFDRAFRRVFSMTPTQYILRVRVNSARNYLSTTGRRIAEVAVLSGFYDQAQLARYFRKLTGMTPSQYRKKFQTSGL